ncbi:putative membrane protein YfcA [Alkalihalobacillus xiaoxiensis]|uniref:Probable membrane transporter protein n=1 Tax=Shouchella xiaoxiensis TaxID=766895 RepID=A0ABS2SX06_9BACI|nr:sulfite exporter TauE/SafE family protein [Shouchella xiaoxiensis]MBM7840078.1 putative membrane protein YfcA [Shouchella xiaoxiensis]
MSLLFISIVLVASLLQTSTGFGFSIIATPFLLMLFVPETAIQLNLVLSIIISLILLYKVKEDIHFPLVKRLIWGSLIGAPLGVGLLYLVNEQFVKIAVGLLLLAVTFLLVRNVTVTQTSARDLSVGSLSGMLTSSIGMPGPPLIVYFASARMTKESIRATTLCFFMIIYPISLFLQYLLVGIQREVWVLSAYALPFVLIGLVLGQIVFKRINVGFFRKLTYVLLLVAGISLLLEAI